MTVYDFIASVIEPYQRISVIDYEDIENPAIMYSGFARKGPYGEDENRNCTISKKRIDIIKSIADTLFIGINYNMERHNNDGCGN